MSAPITIPYPVIFGDTVVFQDIVIPTNAVSSHTQIQAGINIPADKTEQRIYPSHAQPNSAATTETRTLFVARRPGTLNHIAIGSIVAAIGDSTVTVDIKKNGTTVLSGVVTLNSSNTAMVAVLASISGSGAFVAGDWFTVVITAVAATGTLPTGVFVQAEVDQDGA